LQFVEKGMDIRGIMDSLELDSIWIGVYKSVTLEMFNTDDDQPVHTKVKNESIWTDELTLLGFNDNKAIILKKTDDKLSYKVVSKTEKHRCLCLQKIPYPGKNSDILALTAVQKDLVQEIEVLTDTVKISFSKIERSLLLLPKASENEIGQTIATVSVQTELEEKLEGLNELSNRTACLWGKIKSPIESIEIHSIQRRFVQTIRYVERFSRDILEEPLLLLEKRLLNNVGPESIISLKLSETDSSLEHPSSVLI
jgi:hypothetical protein